MPNVRILFYFAGAKMNKTNGKNKIITNGVPLDNSHITKCVYIGKVKNNVSHVDILTDRIFLVNTHNSSSKAKYNITVPFTEINALRYCNERDISIFVIQPIFFSFQKLSNWLNQNSSSPDLPRIVPENFIMIHFDGILSTETIDNVCKNSKIINPKIKIIEINSVFAHSYLNTPNKLISHKRQANFRQIKNTVSEVIHLDDEEDEDDESKVNDTILHRQILKYPENHATQIILYGHDLNCLRDGQYLNDNIMNFYLKYYQHNGDFCQNESILDRIHIYDTLFSNNLLKISSRKRYIFPNNLVAYTSTPFEETYQKVLKRWTKDVDIFSKDFLIIPLIKDSHWFLAILCYIGNLIPPKSEVLNVNNLRNQLPKPTIIFMDSLILQGVAGYRMEITKAIYKYLEQELNEKRKNVNSLPQWNNSSNFFLELHPKVPQQQNYYDCGLFVLEYIEKFLDNPDKIYNAVLKNSNILEKWFPSKSLETKRAKIRQIILNLLPPGDAVKLESELLRMNLEDLNKQNEQE